ncbi:MAG: tRNA (N(6)-L-threonylcarbamoyladenosine(37)-C(2))-methylthiotransferase MtaB [Christensenellales bacterium]
MKAVVFNLGCKVNQYESDGIMAELQALGFAVSQELEYADLYVLNTCAVTAEAERKSRQAAARALSKNPDAKIFVCGCAAERNAAQFSEKDGIVYVSGTAKKSAVATAAKELILSGEISKRAEIAPIPKEYEASPFALQKKTRAFIKVQDGCDNFCSYCILPYLRGRSRSRSFSDILSEVAALSPDIKEIVIIGINLSDFGTTEGGLAELLTALSGRVPRIRLGSLEECVITPRFLAAAKENPSFCPHFHLSLQSGSARILKLMNRKYTPERFLEKLEMIRASFPDAAITTDVIAGFPGETDDDFWQSYEFVKRAGFAAIHCFPYSPRQGTAAYKLPGVEKSAVLRRAHLLGSLAEQLKAEFNHKSIGEELEVLTEDAEGETSGYSRNYIRVYLGDAPKNKIIAVRPKGLYKDGLK